MPPAPARAIAAPVKLATIVAIVLKVAAIAANAAKAIANFITVYQNKKRLHYVQSLFLLAFPIFL